MTTVSRSSRPQLNVRVSEETFAQVLALLTTERSTAAVVERAVNTYYHQVHGETDPRTLIGPEASEDGRRRRIIDQLTGEQP